MSLIMSTYTLIIADSFFLLAALTGRRPAGFLVIGVTFLDAGLLFCLAHHAFFAAPILARAAVLMRRRFWPLADLAWLTFDGRPLRAVWESTSSRAAIACSIRLASCLSCATML